ncbi:MAG: peptidase M48 [Gammaproteobacteria bacterium]|nr:MAG: peptidase M48 [Gammaproteobacteria bacterium]
MNLYFITKKLKPLVTTIALLACLSTNVVFAQSQNKNKLPEIGAAAASVLSLDKERQIGDIMMRQLRASQPIINDPVLIEYINHLGNRLVKNAQDVNYRFKFFLINRKAINAFAFFGGHVAVHSSLVTLADNESELASVLAHEISHVTQRHLARRLESQKRSQPLTTAGMISGVLLALVNPTIGFAALTTTIAASKQLSINYTRGNEKEADRVGIALLANSGFDPQGAPEFFNKLADKFRYASKPPPMLLTHPLPNSRISDARTRAQNYPFVHLAPSLNFELAKARIHARYQGNAKDNITLYKDQISRKKYRIKAAAQYGLAISYFENKQYKQAEKILTKLITAAPKNLFYVDVLADVYVQTKQFKTAIAMLNKLNLLMPNNQVVTLNYANVLLAAGQLNKSAELLQDFLLVQNDNFIAYDLLTEVYTKQERTSMMHANKAEIYALLGAYPRAIDELQTAIKFAGKKVLIKKRIKARILQFQSQADKIKRL